MIREISSYASSETSSCQMQEAKSQQPIHITHHADFLITRDVSSVASTIWAKVKEGFHSFTRFLKRIFCCCCMSESNQEQSLARLKTAQKELKRRLKQVKEGVSSRQALQGWWRQQYDSLHISVRELLLLEVVRTYAPKSANEEEWAKANIDNYRSRASDYVANLYSQTESGTVHDPLDDLSNFVGNVIHILET